MNKPSQSFEAWWATQDTAGLPVTYKDIAWQAWAARGQHLTKEHADLEAQAAISGAIEQAARNYVDVYKGWLDCVDNGGALNTRSVSFARLSDTLSTQSPL